MQQGDKRIALYPADRFKISYTISFDHPLLRHQQKTIDLDEQMFVDEIAPARTFGFLKEVEMLRQRGLALGGSLENAIVLGETGVLNPLRFEDEFVRHKILDVIGDLALVGHPISGHLVVHRGGHALHTALRGRAPASARRVAVRRDAGGLADASRRRAAAVAPARRTDARRSAVLTPSSFAPVRALARSPSSGRSRTG